jgi:hypothetical protein
VASPSAARMSTASCGSISASSSAMRSGPM